MSSGTKQLLQAFEALPSGERQAFAIEVLLRTNHLPLALGSISDEQFDRAGKVLLTWEDVETSFHH